MTARDAQDGETASSGGTNGYSSNVDGDRIEKSATKPGQNPVDSRAYIYVALMVLFGSMTAGAAKIAVAELPVMLVPTLRFGLAWICLLPLVWDRGALYRIFRQDALLLLATSMLCVPINQGFFLSAARLGPTLHVGFFYAICPLVVLLLAWAMRLERPNCGRLCGVLASVAGIVVISLGDYWSVSGASAADVRTGLLADFLLVGAVLSWGGYLAVSKPLVERHGAMPALGATLLVGCFLSLPIAIVAWPGLSRLAQVSSAAWLALAVLAVIITPLGWACQNLSMRRFDASQVATFSNGAPILTVVWGTWLFGELLTPALVAGGTLTLAGIYWASRPQPGRRAFRLESGGRKACAPRDRRPIAAILAMSQEPAAQ